MTEAARRVLGYGLASLGLHRVQASCFPADLASARVLQKIGLRYEGTLRGYYRRDGEYRDAAIYALLQTDERAG